MTIKSYKIGLFKKILLFYSIEMVAKIIISCPDSNHFIGMRKNGLRKITPKMVTPSSKDHIFQTLKNDDSSFLPKNC